MGEILVKRAIDRIKYPKTMMYVDGEGNICRADKPQALSPEEKAARKEARYRDKKAFRDKKCTQTVNICKKKYPQGKPDQLKRVSFRLSGRGSVMLLLLQELIGGQEVCKN